MVSKYDKEKKGVANMKKLLIPVLVGLVVLSLSIGGLAQAAIPQYINYQGKLLDADKKPVTALDKSMTFEIYDTDTTLSIPKKVNVDQGIFSVLLDVDSTVFDNPPTYLKVIIDSETLGPSELISVGYAFKADEADTVDSISDHSVSELSDVSTAVPSSGQVLKWDGSAWAPMEDSGVGTESDTLQTVATRGNSTAKAITVDSDGDEITTIGGDLTVNGKVGIGTDSPGQKVEVRGNLIAGSAADGAQAVVLTGTKVTTGLNYTSGPVAMTDIPLHLNGQRGLFQPGKVIVDEDLDVSGNVIASGKVGIGTTGPACELDIRTPTTGPEAVLDIWTGGARRFAALRNGNVFVRGQLTAANGKFKVDASGKLHVNDVLRLKPMASAPSSPSEGDMYMNSITHKLMVYDGTTWRACW